MPYLKVYEQYVVGMLTNFPSLPLDRIHNMLKMFVSEPPYDKSVHQLEAGPDIALMFSSTSSNQMAPSSN